MKKTVAGIMNFRFRAQQLSKLRHGRHSIPVSDVYVLVRGQLVCRLGQVASQWRHIGGRAHNRGQIPRLLHLKLSRHSSPFHVLKFLHTSVSQRRR